MRSTGIIRLGIVLLAMAALLACTEMVPAAQALPAPPDLAQVLPPEDPIRKPDGPNPPGICPYGYRYDPVTKQCVPVIASPTPWPCPPGYYWDQFLRRCVPDRPIPLPVPLTSPGDRPG